jgi:hypothetical protein
VVEAILILFGVLVGAAVNRWWALAVAVPIGIWLAYEVPIENTTPPHWDVGAVVALVVAAAIAVGIFLRRVVINPIKHGQPGRAPRYHGDR